MVCARLTINSKSIFLIYSRKETRESDWDGKGDINQSTLFVFILIENREQDFLFVAQLRNINKQTSKIRTENGK